MQYVTRSFYFLECTDRWRRTSKDSLVWFSLWGSFFFCWHFVAWIILFNMAAKSLVCLLWLSNFFFAFNNRVLAWFRGEKKLGLRLTISADISRIWAQKKTFACSASEHMSQFIPSSDFYMRTMAVIPHSAYCLWAHSVHLKPIKLSVLYLESYEDESSALVLHIIKSNMQVNALNFYE